MIDIRESGAKGVFKYAVHGSVVGEIKVDEGREKVYVLIRNDKTKCMELYCI